MESIQQEFGSVVKLSHTFRISFLQEKEITCSVYTYLKGRKGDEEKMIFAAEAGALETLLLLC